MGGAGGPKGSIKVATLQFFNSSALESEPISTFENEALALFSHTSKRAFPTRLSKKLRRKTSKTSVFQEAVPETEREEFQNERFQNERFPGDFSKTANFSPIPEKL